MDLNEGTKGRWPGRQKPKGRLKPDFLKLFQEHLVSK